ncbi:hypothetical protein ACTXKH_19210 [Brachybacterium tyrofermentans]|uniref:hypothetical protein n=1 Tax=Brachybacterium tyrofermentans TaxID=47848 RepID=UPI003F92FC44
MNAPDPHTPADIPIDEGAPEAAQTLSDDHAADSPELEEDASFEDEDAGLSVADIDTAVTQMREQPFSTSAYPGSIGDVSVAKLRSSIVAPLVAQARGYRTITGSDDAKDALRRFGFDGRRNPGRHLLSLARQAAWMEIPYFKMDSIARGEPILGTLQLRPEDDPPEGSNWAKYMFLAGSGTAIDAHPATPASWFADPTIPVLLTEGVVKADSVLTAMLRDAGKTDETLSTAVGATEPRQHLGELLEQVPADKRILVLAIPGVQSWRRNDEWNTIGMRDREAIICFDGDIARNAAVWDAAYGLMEFLAKRNTAQTRLIDLSPRGDDTVDPKRGIDDFLAYSGTWRDALGLQIGELPQRPVDDTGEKGQTRVTQDGLGVEVCNVRTDPAGGPDITTWKRIDDIGGRLVSFEEFRMPTADELEGGRIIPGAVSRAERQAVVAVQWKSSEDLVDSAIIRGPKAMLDEDPAKWETRYGADVPTKVSALSSWPPRSGINWTRAIKDYRASESTDDVLWGCQGWVPTRDGIPAFIAGRQVVGPTGAGDERAQAGLTADDFPSIDDYGVIDSAMSLQQQRDLLRQVVDAYTSADTFVDPRFGMVALLAGVRPIVPITPHSVLYIVGGRRSGKSWLASMIQGFWASRGGAWSAERLPGSAMDTRAWMENAVSKSMMWVIDDFAPNSDQRQWEKQTSDLEAMVRSAFNGTGKGRMTSDMKTRVQNPPRSLVVVTAENELQIDSVRDRMLTLYSDDGGGFINPRSADPLATLNAMSRRGDQALLSAQMLRWMCNWAARDSYQHVRTTFMRERDDAAGDARQHVEQELGGQVNATRHAQIVSEYLLSVTMLEQYALDLEMDVQFLERVEAMRDDLAALTVDLSRTQQGRTAGHALVDALRYLLESQKGYVEPLVPSDVGSPPTDDPSVNLRLGWPAGREPRGEPLGRYVPNARGKGRDVIVFSRDAFQVARARARHLIPAGQTARTSWKAVWHEGLAAEGIWGPRIRHGVPTGEIESRAGGARVRGVPIDVATLYDEE